MKRRYLDLLVIDILVIIAAIFALTNSPVLWLRAPIATLAVLVVPGYLLSEMLIPRSVNSGIERMALIVGLSLSFTALGGFLLYLALGQLNTLTWVFFIGAATLLGTGGIFIQRQFIQHDWPVGEAADPQGRQPEKAPLLPIAIRWLPYALALAMVIGSVLYAQSVARSYPHTEVTQMWMIPDRADPAHRIQMGVITNTDPQYKVTVVLKRGNTTIEEWNDIQLHSNIRWQTIVTLPSPLPGSGPLEAEMFDPKVPSRLIRHVSLWPGS